MEALRIHLGLEQIVSIGTSYGGMVAMAHAARYPASVSKLILCVTASHHGFNDVAQAFVAANGTAEQKAVCKTLWDGGFQTEEQMRHYYHVMEPLYSHRHDPLAEQSRNRGTLSPEPLNRAFGPGGVLRTYDLRSELKHIIAPTLILAGRHDWICTPQFSEEIHTLIPGSLLHVYEEASHSLRNDVPQALMTDIIDFVANSR